MSHYSHARAALFAALALSTSARAQGPVPLPLPPTAKPEIAVTVVEHGPVHEGFAEPGANIRGKGITAPKAPPAPVDEVPPLHKPEGANVRWIPGYWQWAAGRDDFVWVCGLYRNAPPQRTWQSGYWTEVRKRWTYFPGYWRPTGKQLAATLSEPPAAKEENPARNENPNAMWVPGYWELKDEKFEWRPGYWPAGSGTAIWYQGQYVNTESGFAFVPGYWDVPLEERGQPNAAVYFSKAQRAKEKWAYRPQFALTFGSEASWGQGGAFDALSIGPNYNCYLYDRSRAPDAIPLTTVSARTTLPSGSSAVSADQPWSVVAPDYTNPLWQHYVRLNRTDSGLAKGTPAPAADRSTGGINPFALVGGIGCRPHCGGAVGCGVGGPVLVAVPYYNGRFCR